MAVKLMLLGHRGMPSGVLETLKLTMGEEVGGLIEVFEVETEKDIEMLDDKIDNDLEMRKPEDLTFILCDLFGGSTSNIILKYVEREGVEVFCGYNLAMVIKLCEHIRSGDSALEIEEILNLSRDNMVYPKDFLRKIENGN